MRGTSKQLGVAAVVCVLVLAAVSVLFSTPAHANGGVTISPATLTLTVGSGQTEQSALVHIANHYSSPVTLYFAVEPRVGVTAATPPSSLIRLGQSSLTIGANSTATQMLTLVNSPQLAPGSQLADVVITQSGGAEGQVGVVPSIRMPVVLVQQDGAVQAIGLTNLQTTHVRVTTPNSIQTTLQNSGNTVAIPHGTVTVSGPTGAIIAHGVINTASQAVSPGDALTVSTPLTQLTHAVWPGVYRTTVSYGLGGGQTTRTASTWFFYAAWWHIVLFIALAAVVMYWIKHPPSLRLPLRLRQKPPPKTIATTHRPLRPKRAIVGRDVL